LKQLVSAWQLQPQTGHRILQLHDTYLAAQTPTGLLLIDQHAAHERILFEQYKAAYASEATKHLQPQELNPPILLNLSLIDSALLEEHLETFTDLGFEIEPFGTTSFKITQVAQLFADHDLPATIKDMLDDIADNKPLDSIDRATDRTLAYLACRHAIKAGEFLTSAQRQELVTKLSETPNNVTCPHGRPVTITYSKSDLERLFRRQS
jgi:DNA mismatch repair protein MutL